MRDFRTTTEADAGRHARAYGAECDDRPTRGEAEADEYALGYEAPTQAPRPTFVEDIKAALAWAGADHTREVTETRRGVAAFKVRPIDNVDRIRTEFGHRGLETEQVDDVLWVRRGRVVPRPDPWAKP